MKVSRGAGLFLLGAVSVAMGCATGPAFVHFPPAVTGHGVEGDLHLAQGHVVGELLEPSDSAYVLINDEGVLLVPFVAVRKASFTDVGNVGMGAPDQVMANRLRLVSRFPQGLSPHILDGLLADNHQSALRVVR